MLIENTAISEVKLITPKIHKDDRGYFFESFGTKYFEAKKLPKTFVQSNEVFSKKGIIRGLHYQLESPQGKLVRAVVGSIFDVAVDIRKGSPTFGHYVMVELSSKNKKMLYVPEGFAHGYLVKSKKSIVSYKCTNSYDPKDEFGIKWNDKDIGIDWKIKSPILSQKDKELPILKNQEALPSY